MGKELTLLLKHFAPEAVHLVVFALKKRAIFFHQAWTWEHMLLR